MLRFLSKLKGKSSKYCFDNLFFYGTKKEVPTLKTGKNQTKYDEESKSNQVTSPECEEVNAFTTYTSTCSPKQAFHYYYYSFIYLFLTQNRLQCFVAPFERKILIIMIHKPQAGYLPAGRNILPYYIDSAIIILVHTCIRTE